MTIIFVFQLNVAFAAMVLLIVCRSLCMFLVRRLGINGRKRRAGTWDRRKEGVAFAITAYRRGLALLAGDYCS